MLPLATLVCAAAAALGAPAPAPSDTLRLEVGAREIDLSGMLPHDARVIVERLVDGTWQPIAEWTNHLTVGDSAGRRVHRWITRGRRPGTAAGPAAWELFQTFDARSIAPLALRRTTSEGVEVVVTFDGPRVRGSRRDGAGAVTPLDLRLSRAAYPAAASDLVPMGLPLRPGLVLTAPVWQLGMSDAETRVFTVIDRRPTPVAGRTWDAWAVEEHALRDGRAVLIGTWYLVEEPPYMVYAEVVGPGGARQRMTEVLIEPTAR